MKYYLVAYPSLTRQDRAWIASYRDRHDLLFRNIIQPHFTIVFGGVLLPEETIAAEAGRLLKGVRAIPFELVLATVNKDSFASVFHEFLVPERGYAAIALLHDRLYSGVFREFLRLDIDYIPHIGVGNDPSGDVVKSRVDTLNKSGISIRGTIETVDLIGLVEDRVVPLTSFKQE